MNREERRRQEKANRQGQRTQKTIPADRLSAEMQDFRAGTIFAAGAAGIRPEGPGPDLPPLFVILLDEKALSPAPELRQLFALLDSEGTVNLHAGIKGTARWGAMPATDGQMLAKVELNLTAPVATRPSVLLLADNYKEIWDIPATDGYLLGLTTMARFASLGPSSSYADAMSVCVLIRPPASNAAKMLQEHYTGEPAPVPTPPPLTIFNGDDDMRYQTGIASDLNTGDPLYGFMLMRPTAVTQVHFGQDSIPTVIASSYAARGLKWFEDGAPMPVAEGWSWKEDGSELVITDSEGILVASFEPESTGEESRWINHVRATGFLILYVGDELVTGDGMSGKDQIIAACERGNVVSGAVFHVDANATSEDQEAPAPAASSESDETPTLPWWKRLFRP